MGRIGKAWRALLQPLLLAWAVLAAGLAQADAPPVVGFPNTGAFTAKFVGASKNVAVVELAGDYSRDLPSGAFNVEPRAVIAKEFYKTFADRYDFIVVFSNFEFATGDAKAFYHGVRNDTQGIAEPPLDNTRFYGSTGGALQGFIDMAALSRYHLDPSDPRFEDALRVLAHEMLHRWGARVHFIDGGGQRNGSLIGRQGSHWSFLLDTGGSVEYGNRWADNGDGTFTTRPDRQFFSPLDLYLMGMLKKEEVPPFFYIESPGVDPARLAEAGVTVSGIRRDVTIDQIIAAEGPRIPDADHAQKEFRLGFVLLTRPGVAASDADVQKVDAVRQAFQTRLAALTGGRAMAHVHLEATPAAIAADPTLAGPVLGAPGSTANVINALSWLRGKQEAAGPWSDNPLTRLRDTVVATTALAQVGGTGASSIDRAMNWLGTQQFTNTDYVARRIGALGGAAAEADWAGLAAGQNADGGWGVAPGYLSTPLDTALAALTLAQDPNSARSTAARARAKTFLVAKQNADGGWSHAVNGASRTATTAQVVRALASLGATDEVTRAAQFLAGRQNTDGGFGDSPSTTHDTSNVMLALAQAGQLNAVRVADGFRFLNATQQADGSWDGSVYATGLAVRTLGTAQTFNWAASLMSALPAVVRDGQRVALAVNVANNGTVAAPPTTLKIYDGDPATGAMLMELPVPALAPGALAVVKGSWNTFGQVGNHLLTALVDPAAQGTEMTRSDNSTTVRVAVSAAPAGADPTVTAADVQALPALVNRLPTPVSVLAQISNLGLADAIGARVRLFAGPVGGTQVLVDEKIVNLLGRSSVAVSTTFQVTQPGRQQLSVVVDTGGTIDADTTNNRADVFVETTSTFDPAIAPSDLVAPATPVTAGADISLTATVHNFGTADSPPFQAVFAVTDGTSTHEVGRVAVQLAAGGSKSFTLPWRVDLTGTLNFKVTLDPAGAVADLDRSNNEAVVAFVANPPAAGPNLAVSFKDFLIDPDPANEGRPLTLRATIRNIGSQAAANIEFGFYEGDPANGGTLLAPIQVLPALAAGDSAPVSAVLANVSGTAERLYFVAVDPAAKIAAETNREDNSAFRTVQVAPMPDLAVSAGDITLSPVAPKPGDTLTVNVEVQNLGGQPAGPVRVRLDGGAGSLGEQAIANIAAHGKGTATFTFVLPAQGAADALTVTVDPDAALLDSNRANNVATRALVVQSGTAFVSEPYFSPNGDGVKDSTSFGFRVGTAAVVRVVVVDGNEAVVRRFPGLGTPPLAEGSLVWDGRDDDQRIARDGSYRFRALAADGTVLAESTVILDTNRTPILRASGTESEYYRNLSCRATSAYEWTTTLDEQSLFLFSQINVNVPGLQGLLRVALQGGETTSVVPLSFVASSDGAILRNLSASARGEVLAFSRGVVQNSVYANEIWAIGGDGTGLRRLAAGAGVGVPPDAAFYYINQLVATHDGQAVVAHLYGNAGDEIRRIPTSGSAGSTVLFRSNQGNYADLQEMAVAPNRRRALLRLYAYDQHEQRYTSYAVLDFETGQLYPMPDGLFPGNLYGMKGKWSPDSSRFLLYTDLQDAGLDDGNRIDFEFDVFDAQFNLEKRFRTANGPGDASWYSGTVDGPEWSAAGDEFAFAHNPSPYWYGGTLTGGDLTALAAATVPGGPGSNAKQFYRASITQGTLVPVPVDYSQFGSNGSGSTSDLWWGPNDRLAATVLPGYPEHHGAIDVDSGAVSELFPNWWREEVNPNGRPMSLAKFAPSGRRLYFTSYRDAYNPLSACYSPIGAPQLFAYESLQNLVADLQPLRDPRVGGILLKGTATDLNFAGWRLEYARTTTPNDWHAVTVPGIEPKVGKTLATWVPPAYGTYFVRLTVEDRAGNSTAALRRVSWSDTPPITDLVKNLDYISPNGDGVQDTLKLTYRVLEPVHLAFEVRAEDGTRVRLVERDHAVLGSDFAFEWDGRDDQGRLAPDGKYTLRVLDYEFAFQVDTQFPTLTLDSAEHAFDYGIGSGDGVSIAPEALRGAGNSVVFDVAPTKYAEVSIVDARGHSALSRRFEPGSYELLWDGGSRLTANDPLNPAAKEFPSGTYVLAFASGEDGGIFARFTVELSRVGGQVRTLIRPIRVAPGQVLAAARAPFVMQAQDALLDYDGTQAEFGYGDPPATWDFGYRNRLVPSLPLGWGFAGSEGEPDGMPTASVSGARSSLKFSGSRLRATARDKAGNAVTAVSPFVVVRESVLFGGTGEFWLEEDPASVQANRLLGSTTYSPTPVPASLNVSLPPVPPAAVLGALNLRYLDNLATPAVRVELRYAFLPEPKRLPGQLPPEPDVLVAPTEADLSLLSWTTLPLRGLAPAEQAPGISQVEDQGNDIALRWQLPHHENGLWLYQLVSREADGQELRSSVHWTNRVRSFPQPPAISWLSSHEPAATCGAAPSEIAQVVARYPNSEDLGRIYVAQRLLRVLPGNSRLPLTTETFSNHRTSIDVSTRFSTADWPVGRHDMVVQAQTPDGTWETVAQPYVYVNHEAPRTTVGSPLEGQKMCASHVSVPELGTIGYLPVSMQVTEPYAVTVGTEREKPTGWVRSGPVSDGGVKACSLPDGCGYVGPISWGRLEALPDRPAVDSHPGKYNPPPSAHVWGLGAGTANSYALDPLDGTTTFRMKTWGVSGHQVCTPVTVDVDGRVDASVAIDRVLFSPNGDGQFDEVVLTVSANEAVTTTVQVFKAYVDRQGVLHIADPTPVATLANQLLISDGDRSFTWDGRTSGGQVAPDGLYAFRVTMVDGCANELIEMRRAEVDNTPPAIVIDSPRSGAPVPIEFVVKGSVNDLHPLRYEVQAIVDSSPDAPFTLPSLAGMNALHLDLARWNTAGFTGPARIVVRAFDAVANVAEITVPIVLTEPINIITSLNAAPDPFSPNGDGRREKISILYTLERAAQVTMALVGPNGPIRTLLQNVPVAAGNAAVVWDGRNALGTVEPDEDVAVVLTAEVLVNGDVVARQVERTTFTLDKTPPVISFTLPQGPVTTARSGAQSRAADPLLATATMSISVNGGAYLSLADSTDASGMMISPLDDIPEGPAVLRVQAADRAENQSSATLPFIIDRTPPVVAISAPTAGAYISGRKQHFKIQGSIEELHLAHWQLELGGVKLTEGTTLPLSNQPLFDWDPLTAADGPTTLTLKADDQAGLSGVINVPITVDNTPPVAAIKATGAPMYLRNGTVVKGTATDLNLASWRIELAPGGVSSTRWTELARGSAEVAADGTLATLQSLPADGLYGLRLTVVDKAGNESQALQEVTVDNTAPQSVLLTASLQNRRDANVKWNAAVEADVAGYILMRNGSRIGGAVLLTTNSYVDPGLAAGTYRYVVKAVDKAGNESEPSNEGSVVVSSSEPVAQIFAPTNDSWAAGIADVRGTASSPADFKEYRLYFGVGATPATWQLIRRSPLPITADTLAAWNTVSLAEGATYSLKLEAEDLSGVIATDRVTVKVKNVPPRAPLQLAGTLNVNNIALTWNANTEPDIQGYLLYRDQRLVNSTGLVIGSLVPYLIKPTAYNDLGVPDGTHRYFVQAMDQAGNISDPSNEVEFKVDTRPPHVTVTKPADGSKVSQSTTLVGESPDSDLKTVQFQFRPEGNGPWTDIGAPLTTASGPWTVEWSTAALAYGRYQVRALGTDEGGKVDPAPGFITLVVTDLRKPDPATVLAARVTGGDVALTWVASASSYATGYHVERIEPNGAVTRLTSAPIAALAYTDPALADAFYRYQVIALSAGGTEATPSNEAAAVVYTPAFEQPYTPTADPSTVLAGQTQPRVHLLLRAAGGGAEVARIDSDDSGAYRFDAVPLALGDNRFELVGSDDLGNTSKTTSWHARRGLAPAMPTGLSATVAGHDVTLAWAANTEADLDGYVAALDGVLRGVVVRPSLALASSEYPFGYGSASNAIDGSLNTAWQPHYNFPSAGQWLELRLATPRLLSGATLQWEGGNAPTRSRLEAWDGEVWVPLAQMSGTGVEPRVEIAFAKPYRTDRIRVLVQEALYTVRLSEMTLAGHDVLTQRSALFSDLPDGYAKVGVVAASKLGLVGPLAETRPAVGDVVPPGAPVLQAQAQGADAVLSWTPPADADVAGWQVFRDGVLIATLPDPSARGYTDASLPNAHYEYLVKAVDAVGNAGAPSNSAGVDIAVAGPSAPITATASAPAEGGLVIVDWTVGSGAQPAAFALFRHAEGSTDFELLASGLSGGPYNDTDVVNGVRYFYLVKGLDTLGNTGASSNEVNARPFDRLPPAVPYLVLPGRAPGPVLTAEASTPLAGYGEPGSTIVITKSDQRLAETSASADPVIAGYGTRGPSIFDLSADGLLMFGYFGNRVAVQTFDGREVPSATLAADNNLNGFRFAPDGRSAAFTRYDNNRGRNVLMRWNRGDDSVGLVSALGDYGHLAFSADGRWLLGRGWDFNLGTPGLLLVDWTSGATRFIAMPDDYDDAAWSPDGSRIALAAGGTLRLIDPQQIEPDLALPALDSPSSLAWLPDGQSLLVEAQGAAGNRIIQRITLATGAVQTLVDNPSVSYTVPTVSPEGDAFVAYTSDGLVRRKLSDGAELLISPYASYGYWPARWSTAGTIAFYEGSGRVYVPAGRFDLADTALDVGANFFSAFGVDAAGNTSAPAPTLEVRRSAEQLPDWQVGAESWLVFPATPQAGESTSVFVTVKNIGAAAPAVAVNVVAVDAAGAVNSLFSGSLGALDRDASQTLRLSWTPAAAGRYTITTLVDPASTVVEASRDNNRSQREVIVTAAGATPEIQVSTSRPRYDGGATVSASVVALNPGAAFDGRIAVRIVDLGGFELVRFDARPVSGLVFGAPQTFAYSWPSGSTLAGDYRVVAELLAADGQGVANGEKTFAIDPGVTLASTLASDRAAYITGDSVVLRGTLRYVSGNVASFGAPARLEVRSAAGDLVASRSLELQGLMAGNEVQVDLAMPATQPGLYTARLSAGPADAPLTQAEAGFEVGLPTAPLITGQLRLVGDVFTSTETITGSTSVVNAGALLSPLPVRVRAVTLGGQALATWTAELIDLGSTAVTQPLSLAGTWPLASFEVRLEAQVGGSWQLLDRARVQAAERTPPLVAFTTPAPGAVVRSSALIGVLTMAQQAPVARAELNVAGAESWLNMQPQGGGTGGYSLAALPAADGPVTLLARAADTLGNQSTPVSLALVVDNTPPLIAITGVADQQLSRNSLTPVITVADANPASQAITLDGAPFVSGTPVGEGVHLLAVDAVDKAGNSSSASLRFTVDLTPPSVVRTSPASGLVVRQMPLVTATASDALSGVATVQLRAADGRWLDLAAAGGSWSITPPAAAADGDAVLALRATDGAGNTSVPQEFTVVIDTLPPTITITGVAQGGRYAGSATPLVTVTDLHPGTSTVLLDGLPYVSGTPVTVPGAHTLEVSATDAAGNASQQSLGFQVDSAVSLAGTLGVSPQQVPVGTAAVFDARIDNTGINDLAGVVFTLTLRDRTSGNVLQTFTDTAPIAAGGSYQHAWSWTAAGTPGAFVDAQLVAVAGGVTVPIAQGSLQLAAPPVTVDLQQQVLGVKKTLVYVRCTKLEDETWDNCATGLRAFSNAATVASCTVDRAGWLDQYLTTQGVAHTVVTDEASFLRELRTGAYSTYWLGGAALKLGALAAAEVQAAVRRGDTLLTENWSAGRNAALEPVTGLSWTGKWSSQTAYVAISGGGLPAVTLLANTPVRVTTTTGTRLALMNNGPGIVAADYGRGHSLAFAFDLSGTLRGAGASTLATWNTVLAASYNLLARTAPVEVAAGGRFNLQADLLNTGAAPFTFDLVSKAPAAALSLSTTPTATAVTAEGGLPTLRWRGTEAAAEKQSFTGLWKAPMAAGDYVMSGMVSQVAGDGSSTLLQSRQLALKVYGAAELAQATFDAVQPLALGEPGASAKTQALRWLTLAKMSVADSRWNDALRQLAAAQAALQPAGAGADVEAARLLLARAIEAVERQL